MTIETLKCRQCGSTDVVALDTGRYACRHCESIFSHLIRAAGTSDEFCICGGAMTARCFLCGTGLCLDCDLLACGSGGLSASSLAASLDLVKIGRLLEVSAGHPVRHLCMACAKDTMDAVVSATEQGTSCADWGCPHPPRGRCSCCQRSVCSVAELGADRGPITTIWGNGSQEYWSQYCPVLWPELSLCQPCITEWSNATMRALESSDTLSGPYSRSATDTRRCFRVDISIGPKPSRFSPGWKRAFAAEASQTPAVSEQIARATTDWLRKSVGATGCRVRF